MERARALRRAVCGAARTWGYDASSIQSWNYIYNNLPPARSTTASALRHRSATVDDVRTTVLNMPRQRLRLPRVADSCLPTVAS